MATVSYSERVQSKAAKETMHRMKCGHTRHMLPVESQDVLSPQQWERLPLREAQSPLSAQSCTWGRLHCPLPAVCRCSRRPEGEQAFPVNQYVCANSVDLARSALLGSGNGGVPPEIHVPRCQPRVPLASRSFKGQ